MNESEYVFFVGLVNETDFGLREWQKRKDEWQKREIKTKSTHLVNQWKRATLCETRHGEIRKNVPGNCQVTE